MTLNEYQNRRDMTAKEFVEELKRRGCTYDQENGGILSANGKRKGHLATNGYKIVMIQKDKRCRYMCEQRCVWWWFHPDTDESMVVDHLNCDRGDNRIENLEAVTSAENARRTSERGRCNPPVGEKSGKTKLTDREALAIRYLQQQGMPRKDIAAFIVGDKAKAPRVTVDRIVNKVRFGHLEDPADIWAVYPTIVAATADTGLPEREQVINAAMGLSGEVGEVVDILKKHLYHKHPLDEDHLKEEVGDVLFYLTWLSVLVCGFDRAEIMLRNAAKLLHRYPNGFEADRSIHREE